MSKDILDAIAKEGRSASISDVMMAVDMIRNGDVFHIDGDFMTALDGLATVGEAGFMRCHINRMHDFRFTLFRAGMTTDEETAIGALIEAQRVALVRDENLFLCGWTEADAVKEAAE